MKKIFRYIFLILIVLVSMIMFAGCNKDDVETTSSNSDTIQLWYGSRFSTLDEEITKNIIKNAESFCDKNNINLDIVKFDKDILTYDDYVFKRNLAAENGNMIIIDDISGLFDLAKNHADYTKIKAYNDILSPYKNRFCIPIGRQLKTSFFDNAILEYYNIDIPKRPVITYIDYLEIKQELKKRGAKFELKNKNFHETRKYYLNANGLLYINRQDEILKDSNKLKEALKKSLFDICNDILVYNGGRLDDYEKIDLYSNSYEFDIYDSNSNLHLKKTEKCDIWAKPSIYPEWFKRIKTDDITNKIFIIDHFGIDYYNHGSTISLFIYKKVTNKKIYDLANYLLEQSSIIFNYSNNAPINAPIFYTKKALNLLMLNEDLIYIGEKLKSVEKTNEDERNIINTTLDIFAKDEFKSKEIADAYFADSDIVRDIEDLIYNTIYEIAQNLSDDNSEVTLSLARFNREDKEINKLVDKKIYEFIKQLILIIN